MIEEDAQDLRICTNWVAASNAKIVEEYVMFDLKGAV